MRMNVSRVYSATTSSHSGPGKHSSVFTEAPDSRRELGGFFSQTNTDKYLPPKNVSTKNKNKKSYAHIYTHIYIYIYR